MPVCFLFEASDWRGQFNVISVQELRIIILNEGKISTKDTVCIDFHCRVLKKQTLGLKWPDPHVDQSSTENIRYIIKLNTKILYSIFL